MLTFAILACLAIYSAVPIPDRGTRRRRVVAAPVRSGQHGACREVLTAAQHPGLVASHVSHSVADADSADCDIVLDERAATLPTPSMCRTTTWEGCMEHGVQPPARGRAHVVSPPHDGVRWRVSFDVGPRCGYLLHKCGLWD